MKIRPWLMGCLALLLALSLAACGAPSTPEETPTPPSDPPGTSQPDPAPEDASLTKLRQEMKENGNIGAIAFLGTLPQGDRSGLNSLLQHESLEAYPFLRNIPEDRITQQTGDEVYCLVPLDETVSLTVQELICNESNHYQQEPGKVLFSSQDGQPVLLIGNQSDIIPNLFITLKDSSGQTLTYAPSLSLCDGSVALPVGDALRDFSPSYRPDTGPLPTDFLGDWVASDGSCGLSFAADTKMTFWYGPPKDQPQGKYSGTFYVISESAQGQYPPGSVMFEMNPAGNPELGPFWGIFTITRQGSTLTVTHVTGDLLLESHDGKPLTFSPA